MHPSSHDIGEPSEWLLDNLESLPKGRVLDIAMGSGRNSLYLAKIGNQVEGVDVSEKSIKKAIDRADAMKLRLWAETADLEKEYQIKKGRYDLIICFNYLQRSLIPQIKNGLHIGGMILYETYIIDQAKFGKPKSPDYLLRHNELLDMFRDFRCLRYYEGVVKNQKAKAGILAEKIRR